MKTPNKGNARMTAARLPLTASGAVDGPSTVTPGC